MKTLRTTGDAIAIATSWTQSAPLNHFAAFIGGSSATRPLDSPYDASSDVDCYVVIDGEPPEGKIGKIVVEGVLLDVTWIPWNQVKSAKNHAVVSSLINFGLVIFDTDDRLTNVQRQIRETFLLPSAIETRLTDMRQRIRGGLSADSSHLCCAEQVMNWIFPATLVTHIPLIAACAPLTVRKRFVAAKRVMAPKEYEALLALFGFHDVTVDETQAWLNLTDRILSENQTLAESSTRFWAGDIRTDARNIAINGSQQLIDAGLHKEALYWIIATCARCLTVRSDANMPPSAHDAEVKAMLKNLGLSTAEQRAIKAFSIVQWSEQYVLS